MVKRKSVSSFGIALLATGLALALSSCSLPDETAAVVNGQEIATATLERAYEEFIGQFGEGSLPEPDEALRTRKALLDRLIDQEIMLQEVRRRGLLPTAEEIDEEVSALRGELRDREFESVLAGAGLSAEIWRERVVRDLSLKKLQQKVIFERASVTDDEIEEYRREHRTDSDLPEEVRVKQILVRTREEALEAARRIRGGEPFSTVAREISLSPDRAKGGDIGYFSRGQMPQEFDAVTFSLPVGKLSPVVETTYGYHLFLVTDRREARRKSDEEVRREVRSLLLTQKTEEAFLSWMAELRASADIRYNNDVVPK